MKGVFLAGCLMVAAGLPCPAAADIYTCTDPDSQQVVGYTDTLCGAGEVRTLKRRVRDVPRRAAAGLPRGTDGGALGDAAAGQGVDVGPEVMKKAMRSCQQAMLEKIRDSRQEVQGEIVATITRLTRRLIMDGKPVFMMEGEVRYETPPHSNRTEMECTATMAEGEDAWRHELHEKRTMSYIQFRSASEDAALRAGTPEAPP